MMEDDNDSDDGGDIGGLIPKKKLAEVRNFGDMYIYLKQNPRTFLSIGIFITTLAAVLGLGVSYSVDFHPNSCYFVAGIAGIVTNLYGFCHFRTLMNLKKEVDVYSTNNKKFSHENHALTTEVNRFTIAKTELQDTSSRIKSAIARQQVNLVKFRELNVNLEATGKKNLELLGGLNKMADDMHSKWHEQLFAKERKILQICFDRFEFESGQDGITREQFTQFKLTLPMEYQLRLTRAGDWNSFAGDDGVLQLNEFIDLLDKFAEDVVSGRGTSAADEDGKKNDPQ